MAQRKAGSATKARLRLEPELAGIVLALGAPPETIDAVRSLQAPRFPASGAIGPPIAKMAGYGHRIPPVRITQARFLA
jgi:hypothetical protein